MAMFWELSTPNMTVITKLNIVFSVTCYLELHNAISFNR